MTIEDDDVSYKGHSNSDNKWLTRTQSNGTSETQVHSEQI